MSSMDSREDWEKFLHSALAALRQANLVAVTLSARGG